MGRQTRVESELPFVLFTGTWYMRYTIRLPWSSIL
jgi:hypothetical protein